MAKKTRKEKMAAQIRRLRESSQSEEQKAENTPNQISLGTINLKTIQTQKPVINRPVSSNDRYDYSHISGDLKKIGLLMLLTISLEVAVNLTMRTSFAKLILRTFGLDL